MEPSSETRPIISRKFLVDLTTCIPCALDNLGEQRRGQLQFVLYLHLGDVRIGAGLEGQVDGHGPAESLVEDM